MTAEQADKLRDGMYPLGNYLNRRHADIERKTGRVKYWTIINHGDTFVCEGHAAFSSYGEAKNFLTRYLKYAFIDLKQYTKKKEDPTYGTDAKKLLEDVFKLEGEAYERALIEVRDILLETRTIEIRENEY